MGLFKKIFKPVRKVLDKVIPNELKPFLPYAAAAVPFLAPASFGAGAGLGGLLKRGLITGVLPNIASQLAQEGADDDINWLSAALAGTTGGLTASDAASTFANLKTQPYGVDRSLSFLDKTKNFGLSALEKGSKFLTGAADTLKNPGMNMETLKAASIPFIQGTGDAMAFEADRAMEAYRLALAEYDAEQAALGGGSNEGRRAAILAAMKAYNHPEELIESTLAELGLRDGGRVGYAGGGGIEVLLNPKRKNFASGGWHPGVGRDTKGYQTTSPHHSGGGGGGGPPSITNPYVPPANVIKKKPPVPFESDVHPMYQKWITPAAAVKTDFLKKHGWYSKPFFKSNPETSAFLGTDTATQNQTLYDQLSTLTMEEVLNNMAGGKYDTFPTDVQENLKEQVLGKVDFGKTFQKDWPGLYNPVIDPTIEGGKIDIDAQKGDLVEEESEEFLNWAKDGGRVGYAGGGGITDIFAEASFSKPDFGGITEAIGNVEEKNELLSNRQNDLFMLREEAIMNGDDDKILEIEWDFFKEFGIEMPVSENITEESVTQMAAQGGIMGYNNGGSVLPPGIEMDYRGGGFIPMGSQERADDVPARVSKNEFVMTADAVKAAGGGSVNKGAQRMYDLMNNLEARA
jgi:hypothetical protein